MYKAPLELIYSNYGTSLQFLNLMDLDIMVTILMIIPNILDFFL